MQLRYYIGIDDTDFGDSIGTGAFSRELAFYLTRELGIESQGITRHQFLIHPDIPFTSHNSSACIEANFDGSMQSLIDSCEKFIGFLEHPGADPGLCVALPEHLTEAHIAFGRLAQSHVVNKVDAQSLATQTPLHLSEHGGEGIGIIGALCGCALRKSGDDGRFIAHRGIREVSKQATVGWLKQNTAVQRVVDTADRELDDAAVLWTNSWVRPELVQGVITQRVNLDEKTSTYFIKKQKKLPPKKH